MSEERISWVTKPIKFANEIAQLLMKYQVTPLGSLKIKQCGQHLVVDFQCAGVTGSQVTEMYVRITHIEDLHSGKVRIREARGDE